ncbi:MAG: cytochrome c maturation protein CcmE [Chloroflexi bacterium]|nr:cytochrome c maturation protein CcmE [Chloroflexota bacterium]
MGEIVKPQDRIGPFRKSQLKFLVGGGIIILAILLLIANSFRGTGAYYITVSELNAKGADAIGRSWRISGPVDKESVQYDASALTLKFDMTEDGHRLPVVYHDVMPDLLMKSTSVIVEGRIDQSGVFEASSILVKCPSKYESQLDAGQEVPPDHTGSAS